MNVLLSGPVQHPVTWQPSADGNKLVGHMILRKSVEGPPGNTMAALGKGTLGKTKPYVMLQDQFTPEYMYYCLISA